jgi:hypothetical protein
VTGANDNASPPAGGKKRSKVCPGCGGRKIGKAEVCRVCWLATTRLLDNPLLDFLGARNLTTPFEGIRTYLSDEGLKKVKRRKLEDALARLEAEGRVGRVGGSWYKTGTFPELARHESREPRPAPSTGRG